MIEAKSSVEDWGALELAGSGPPVYSIDFLWWVSQLKFHVLPPEI
jgi:hypothetical protein